MKRYFFTFFFSGMKFRPTPRGDKFFLGENLFNKIFFGIEKKITSKCFRELLSDFPLKESSGGGIQFSWDFFLTIFFGNRKRDLFLIFLWEGNVAPNPPTNYFQVNYLTSLLGMHEKFSSHIF